MPEYTGKDLYAEWNAGTSGTVLLGGDSRTVSWNPSVGMVDATAGSDPFKVYLATVKDTTVSWAGVAQSGSVATENAMREGQYGTLTIAPEGTTAAKRKYTVTAFSQGAKFQFPYSDVVELATDFQGSGTATYGTY